MSSENFTLCQIEIPVSQIEVSLRFYKEVFGWDKVPADIAGYYILDVPSEFGFGISLTPHPISAPRHPFTSRLYFKSQNTEQCLEAIKTNGGKILSGPSPRPGYGLVWRFQDPDGHQYGLFQET